MTKQDLPETGFDLTDIIEAFPGPIDFAITGIIARLASAELRDQLAALSESNEERSIARYAEIIGLPAMAFQLWVGRDTAALTGKPVEVPLGPDGGGAIVIFRPKAQVIQ